MDKKAASAFLNKVIDYKEIAKLIEKDKSRLTIKIRDKVRRKISNLEPKTCLSFRLAKNGSFVKEVKLDATLEYAKVLVAYMGSNAYKGYTIESSVTPIALQATEEAIVEFYSSSQVSNTISEGISTQIRESKIIKKILSNDIKHDASWLKKEIDSLLAEESSSSIAGNMIDSVSDSIVSFLSSAMGQKLMAAIGKFMATGMGKILMKQIAVVVSKALASGILKSAIIVAVKKIGIGILIKTAVGKAILALLALVGISGIPIAWIILPILVGILIYEYNTFPGKLAKEIPDSIAESIQNDFTKLNNTIIQEMTKVISKELVEHLTKLEK